MTVRLPDPLVVVGEGLSGDGVQRDLEAIALGNDLLLPDPYVKTVVGLDPVGVQRNLENLAVGLDVKLPDPYVITPSGLDPWGVQRDLEALAAGGTAADPFTTAGLVLWLRADRGTGAHADGDPVASWADQSVNNNDAIQATGGLQPLYKTSIINGLPVVRFDGVDDFLLTPVLTLGVPAVEVFGILRTATSANKVIWETDNSGLKYIGAQSDSGKMESYVNTGVADAIATSTDFNTLNTPYRVNWQFNIALTSGETSVTVNGGAASVSGAVNNLADITSDALYLGARISGINWAGDIGEFIIFNRLLSSPERAEVVTYLSRWGV